MTSLTAILAPVALLLVPPAPASDASPGAGLVPQRPGQVESGKSPVHGWPGHGWLMLDAMDQIAINRQIRIERRVTIRVSPSIPAESRSLMADLPRGALSANFVERKFGKCVPISAIAGVQPGQDNRLMLYLRDQRIISANLERACSARDFYSGFYVEQNTDGMLCVDRDKLHSRTGANCELARLRQMVAK